MGKKAKGKYTLSRRDLSEESEEDSKTPEHLGKPKGTSTERVFMAQLHDGKLEEITAESKVEILCSKYEKQQDGYYAGRQAKSEDDNFIKQKLVWVRKWFFEKQENHFQPVWDAFVQGIEKWRYEESTNELDFPSIFFVDECDLSYIIRNCLKSQHEEMKKQKNLSNSQLLFCSLLSLIAHDSIPFQLLKILEFYFDDIIQGMNGLFPLIEKEYLKKAEHLGDLGKEETRESQKMSEDSEKKELHEEEHKYHEDMEGEEMRENRSLSNDIQLQKTSNTSELEEYLCQSTLINMVPKQEEIEEISRTMKRKMISKAETDTKRKKGRPPKQEEFKEFDPSSIDQAQLSKVIKEILSYIAFAYKYAFPFQLEKEREMGILGQVRFES